MKAKTWKGDRVLGTCDRCGSQTEVSRSHYITAKAFNAPIWCVDCVTNAGGAETATAGERSQIR